MRTTGLPAAGATSLSARIDEWWFNRRVPHLKEGFLTVASLFDEVAGLAMQLRLEIEAQTAHVQYDQVFGAEDARRRSALHRSLRHALVKALGWKAEVGGLSTKHLAATLRHTHIKTLEDLAAVVAAGLNEKGTIDAGRVADALLPGPSSLEVGPLRDLPLQMRLVADYCHHRAADAGLRTRGRPRDETLDAIVAAFGPASVAREFVRRRLEVKAGMSDEDAVAQWIERLKKRRTRPAGKKSRGRS